MFNLWLDYPSMDEEIQIVKRTTSGESAEVIKVLSAEDIVFYQGLVRRVPVSDNVISYAVNLVTNTRPNEPIAPKFIKDWIRWGAGPRASQYLILGAKARAILAGRPMPDLDDVRAVARPVLRHRLVTNFSAEAEGVSTVDIVDKLLEHVNG
jgi:MoxR-like ATPase